MSQLRVGDFVKLNGFRGIEPIVRIEKFDEFGSLYWTSKAGENRWAVAYSVPLTVADAFALAGFPVPDGAKIVWVNYPDTNHHYWHWLIYGNSTGDWEDGRGWLTEQLPEGDDSWWKYPNQSRTPLSDAWESLPQVIRDAVEAKNGTN